MNDKFIRVNLHTHSTVSDGDFTPEQLAERLAGRGVSYAALTDHDTGQGSLRFRESLTRLGMGCIDGMEITSMTRLGEAHVLAYGINISDADLIAFLPQTAVNGPRVSNIPPVGEAISVIHRAGGAAFLAHPLHLTRDFDALDALLGELAAGGLDGIEALYAGYGESDSQRLLSLASRHRLAVSAGGDFHSPGNPDQSDFMEMGDNLWKGFREVLFSRSNHGHGESSSSDGRTKKIPAPPRGRRRTDSTLPGKIIARIVIPAVSAVSLFILSVFLLLVPSVEKLLLERKKESIRDLTHSAVSILSEYEALAANGSMSIEQAKDEAVRRLRDLRYGRDNKDYFWITDMHPRMIMHPYRSELEGLDLTDFRDAGGQAVFVEFVHAVLLEDEGYFEYLWQWEDDGSRIVPKLSFVQHYVPWDWVIGTGIYLEDVREEIGSLSSHLIFLCMGISTILALLIALMVHQSLSVERGKRAAESALHESRERYRALADGSTDGTVIVLGDACTFANGAFLAMTGYEEKDIQLLRVHELLEGDAEKNDDSSSMTGDFRLITRSGEKIDVHVTGTPFALAERSGVVLSIKDVGAPLSAESDELTAERRRHRYLAFLAERTESAQLWLNSPSFLLEAEFLYCAVDEPLLDLLLRMGRSGLDTALVAHGGGTALGVITASDIALRVAPDGGMNPAVSGSVMTSPLVSVVRTASLAESLSSMRRAGTDRIALRSAEGRITGFVKASSIAMLNGSSLTLLSREAGEASSVAELADIASRAVYSMRPAAAAGARSGNVLREYSLLMDALTEKLIFLVVDRLGGPPAEWVFLSLGSMGRAEMLPGSDQDNALVWRHTTGNLEKEREYFLDLGENICAGLEKIGLPLCPGNVMASNPSWNGPMHEWEARIARSIHEPESEKLLDLEILLDFRASSGSSGLADDLRRMVYGELEKDPLFFIHLAQSVRMRKTPSSALRASGKVNLKELSAAFSGFTRMYALQKNLMETNTFERLRALADLRSLRDDTCLQLSDAFEAVLAVRLSFALRFPPLPADSVMHGLLSGREAALLTFAAEQASLLQKKIGFDFLGSAF
jgi:PAS domain S-box-containing protein